MSDKYCGAIYTTEKNSESGYYLVKWTSDSYNFQYYHKLVKYVIKSGELVCDAVYLNTLANFKRWYTPNEIENQEKIVRLNTVVLTKVKAK